MGILDDAIKEHLELKRQHGAGESELQQLEDEAFGAAERPGDETAAPDPVAEAPTEFMTQPDAPSLPKADAPEAEAAPEPEAAPADEPVPADADTGGRPQPRAEIADLQEPPEPVEPVEEESPAIEHDAVVDPVAPSGPSTEEREAIAEQPTEMFDVEEEIAAEEDVSPDEVVVEEDDDDDFFDEQRLSDELDQALEAPAEEEGEAYEEEGEGEADEPEDDAEVEEDEEPRVERQHEDVLEETPDFLEEAPEDDQLWFEQKPPKDFDFDD